MKHILGHKTDPENKSRQGEAGAALIVVAVLLVFAGVFLSLGLGVFNIEESRDYEMETRKKMDRVARQLSAFVQRNYRLPCPADPAVARGTSAFGVDGRAGPQTACARVEGVLPFRALGISERDAVDGWGSHFTYRVSPVFAETDRMDIVNDDSVLIHQQCLLQDVWRTSFQMFGPGAGPGNPPSLLGQTLRSMSRRKAAFCCPGRNTGLNPDFAPNTTDILIAGLPLPLNPRSTTPAHYDQIGTVSDISNLIDDNIEAYAFVLVSHGPNGAGAFLINGTADRGAVAGLSANEIENANGMDAAATADERRTFVDAPRIMTEGGNYYDDLVFYRTQHEIYAEVGGGTCAGPFR